MKVVKNIFLIAFLVFFMSSKAQIVINEIMASNASANIEQDFYNFPDWIELYNTTNSSIQLSDYYLSDEKINLKKWHLPSKILGSKSYIVLYCDKENSSFHTNFGLETDGETVYLSNLSGNIIDTVIFGQQYSNVSYGRNPDYLNQLSYCSTPTPGEENILTLATYQSPKAEYSLRAGRISANSPITLTGDQIRYSTDGSEPTEDSWLYSEAVNIPATTILKTKVYKPGYLPGEPKAHTYFVNEHTFSLPVISISMTPEFLWDNVIGIYVTGSNGVVDNCTSFPANWNQPWERAGYIEYFDENGYQKISQPVGIKISGGCSRSFTDQKSMSVYARAKYGDSYLNYPFFKEKPVNTRYKSLFIRNSGNDFNRTRLWDGTFQALVNQSVDIESQSFTPVTVYLNGEYWGLMNIREKVNEDYFLINFGIPNDSIDLLEIGYGVDAPYYMVAMQGSNAEYNQLMTYVEGNSLADDNKYNYVASKIDIDNYLFYMAIQIYIANTDWPGNNVKIWKHKNNGKWRWVIFDTDFGFNNMPYTHNTIAFATQTGLTSWPNPDWSTLLFRKLLENEGFKNEFIKTIYTVRNTIFNPERCNYVIDSLANIISDEIIYHKEKYNESITDWNNAINNFKQYALDRYNFIPDYVDAYFTIKTEQVNISISNPDLLKGKVKVNNSLVNNYPFNMTIFRDYPMNIEAVPETGFIFKHWKEASQIITENIIPYNSEWSYLDEASDYPVKWKDLSFDDSSWKTGIGRFGYGEANLNTTISYGMDAQNKIPTALFRKKITINNLDEIDIISINVISDDGFILYVNDTAVGRYNLPESGVVFNSYTETAIESTTTILSIDKSVLNEGENIFACEVHQVSASSSDLVFDLSMTYSYTIKGSEEIFSTDRIIMSDTSYNIAIEPVFDTITPIDGIYLNEIASASWLFLDEYGEKSDFIEIYNSNNTDASLCGFFLSDDKTNLTRYAIPDSFEIKGNGFSVFYADAEAIQGDLHTCFKPGENGESIILSQKVGKNIRIIDSISFKQLVDKTSFGKYEDGTGNWQYMKNITPGLPNDSAIYIIGISVPEISYVDIKIYPNPSSGEIFISVDSDELLTAKLKTNIFDITGKLVKPETQLINSTNNINLEDLNDGIYFIRISDKNRLIYSGKIVITK